MQNKIRTGIKYNFKLIS